MNTEVGVIHDYALRELRLFTDYGRTSRPLFIVDDNQLVFKRHHLRSLLERWASGVEGFEVLGHFKSTDLGQGIYPTSNTQL